MVSEYLGNDPVLEEKFKATISSWLKNRKYENNYNIAGNDSVVIIYSWDKDNALWAPYNKRQYTYGKNGGPTYVFSYWNTVSLRWQDIRKREQVYNANGDVISITDYNLDFSSQKLVESSLSTYSYDIYGNKTVTLNYSWDKDKNNWVPKDRFIFYYSEPSVITTSVHQSSDVDISLYPNPATQYIKVNLPGTDRPAKLKIFDLQGKKALDQLISGTDQVNVAQLKPGIYVYQLLYSGKSQSGKIIIK